MKNRRPQILLLGNGINKCFGGLSWAELVEAMKSNPDVPPDINGELPFPLLAVLLTDDHVDRVMREKKDILFGKVAVPEHREILRSLLSSGFDYILTTNYSYELEIAATDREMISEYRLKKLCRHTDAVSKNEAKYLLHTFNEVEYNGVLNRVFHIHGEARKPDSMIIGHYYYGNLFSRMKNEMDKTADYYLQCQLKGKEARIRNWMDAFVLGDVYVLGFGLDPSEFDLWWLLNRKKREKAEHGETVFYEPLKLEGSYNERIGLLKTMGIRMETADSFLTENEQENKSVFRCFYIRAVVEIKNALKIRKEESNE